MRTIEIPESSRCTVVGVAFRMHCDRCGMVWDVYLNIDANPPDLWDVCRNCLSMLDGPTKETSNKYEYKFTRVLAKYDFLNHG